MGQTLKGERVPLCAELFAQLQDLNEVELEAEIDLLLAAVLDHTPKAKPLPLIPDQQSEDTRIVITGIGVVSPFGVGIQPFWEGLTAGQSAITRIRHFDPSAFPCQIAAQVPDFTPQKFMETNDARRMSRASQFAVAAARMAVESAHLRIDSGNHNDMGSIIASSMISMPDVEQAAITMLQCGPMMVNPLFVPSAVLNMPASQVALQLGLRGHTAALSTACAAGAQAIGEAAELIRRGDAEVMLAGGAEAAISALNLASLGVMRTLSTGFNDDPTHASRPFDARRDGFVVGEGAGVVVLERLSSARRRGAPILAEVIGYATTTDMYQVTLPDQQGHGAARAMRRALQRARLSPQQVDYINAHAPSTLDGDLAETRAIKQVFGEYAYSMPISANKSMIGHLSGAAGAVEAVATILTLQHGLIPPTINLDQPGVECDLDYVPYTARPARLQVALSNSFSFGGVNAVLIFKKL